MYAVGIHIFSVLLPQGRDRGSGSSDLSNSKEMDHDRDLNLL
jgi:hypothetical protein